MKLPLLIAAFALAFQPSLHAGGDPESIMKSGFEFVESCINFDGVGDSIAIPMITMSGDFLHDGVLTLYRGFDTVEIGNAHDQTYSVRLVDRPDPTLYFINYSFDTIGATMPINANAYVMCVVFGSD